MVSNKKKIILNSGIYSVINLIQKGINFLLIPVLTAYLTTFDYGVVAVVTAINAFLNVLYLLSLNGSLNRFYFEYENDKSKLKKLFGTIVTFVFLFSIVLTLILWIWHEYLIDPFLDNVHFYPYMFLGMISVLLNQYSQYIKAPYKLGNWEKDSERITFCFLLQM